MKRLAMLLAKLNKSTVAASFAALTLCPPLMAKAPVTTGHEVITHKKMRHPAQLALAPLESYMDMECRDFLDKSNKDEFVISFRNSLNELSPKFCDQVKDVGFEEDLSQAQREFVGPGTFSKMLEAHYHEFEYNKQLNHYQNLECNELVDIQSQDEFNKFFRSYVSELNPNICEIVKPYDEDEMDSDVAQADRQFVGQGTFAKIVEEAFNEYFFSYKQ